MIHFSSRKVKATLLDPRENFALKTVETEIRTDPLTGDSGRLAHFGMIKPQKEDFAALDTEKARQFCPFCPENISKMTPRFPEDLVPEGHLFRGDATVICNISPYDQYSALTVMSKDHLVSVDMLTENLLKNAFQGGLDFCRIVREKEPGLPYHLIAWNYMPPSGGGLVHPHQQVIITDAPGNLYRKTIESSLWFARQHGENFWEILCETEQKIGERYIGKVGRGHWLVPFVPLGVLGEFMAVFPGVQRAEDLKDETLDDLVHGLRLLLDYFDSQQIYSFNLGLYLAPHQNDADLDAEKYYALHVRIVPRTFLNLKQRPPDTNLFQVILQEPFTVVSPETQCGDVKPFFHK